MAELQVGQRGRIRFGILAKLDTSKAFKACAVGGNAAAPQNL
jgi:hypothetical protein